MRHLMKKLDRLVARALRTAYRGYWATHRRYRVALGEPYHNVTFTSLDPHYSAHTIGDGTYGRPNVLFWPQATLRIGKYCSIANDATILLGGEHHLEWITTYPFNVLRDEARHLPGYPLTRGDVTIGNDVWIGVGTCILSGITIGNGAVIAAGSMVTRDVEPYEVVGGNPARHIKTRFAPEIVEDLLNIAWWDWDEARIQEAWPLLLSPNIHEFVELYRMSAHVPASDTPA